jgi:hypothetical protein
MCKIYYRIYTIIIIIIIIIIEFYLYRLHLLATGHLLNLCSVGVRHFTSASHRFPLPKEKKNLVFFKGHIRLLILNIISVINVRMKGRILDIDVKIQTGEKTKCSDINLPHWHTVTANPTRTGLRLAVTVRWIFSWSTSFSEVILNDWVGGTLVMQRNKLPALEYILKHCDKIKVYYSPTNTHVIVLKTILKFT